jgi:mercuric ion transport protein
MNMNRLLWTGLIGSTATAVCCFTPLLTSALGIVGLGAATRYLDYMLLPALAGFLGLTVYGLSGRNRKDHPGCCQDAQSHQVEKKL